MCGIFAYAGHLNASNLVYQALRDLEYRGYDSWGIVCSTNDKLSMSKAIGFLPPTQPILPQSHLALGHTRWATHGGVTISNAHPHLSCDGRFAIVHNGIFENFMAIKTSLSSSHIFLSQTDTEVIVHFIEEKCQKGMSPMQAVTHLVNQMKGLNAFVLLDHQTKEFIAYRHGSPLVLGKSNEGIYISSDLPTLTSYATEVHPLTDGELISSFALPTSLWTTVVASSRSKVSSLTSTYHMEREIKESYTLLRDGFHFDSTELSELKQAIKKVKDVVLVGCGSAYFACLYGEYLFAKKKIKAHSIVASNSSHYLDLINSKTLVIAVSQSGETIDTLEFVQAAKERKAKIACITNVPLSTLDRLCDYQLHLNVGTEVAVASTKAYVYMNLAFYALTSRFQVRILTKELGKLFDAQHTRVLQDIVNKLLSLSHLYILGTGPYYPLALEAALKFKEIGYLHAEAIISGEIKHGPLALVTSGTVCLILDTPDNTQIVNAEIRARGGVPINLEFPKLGILNPIFGTVYIHSASYLYSLAKKHNPDRPRNLAKSVTVK